MLSLDWSLFIILLLPNLCRQVSYYIAHRRTGRANFCESFETLWLMRKGLYFLGWIEEIFFAFAWTLLFPVAPFLAFGWLFDSFQDTAIASLFPKNSPFEFISRKLWPRELAREVLLPYAIAGPLLWIAGMDIKITAATTLALNLGLIAFQLAQKNRC